MNTDTRLTIVALILIAIIAVVSVGTIPPPPAPSGSVRSSAKDGAMALKLWLAERGYTTTEVLTTRIAPESYDALFVLNPLKAYSPDDAERLRLWVQRGGRLIVAGAPLITETWLHHFDVNLIFNAAWRTDDTLPTNSATLNRPAAQTVQVGNVPAYRIESARTDIASQITDEHGHIMISFPEGAGMVWVLVTAYPLTNLGLRYPGSGELALNLLAGLPGNAQIAFDEAVHGFGEGAQTLSAWLFTTSPGWGIVAGTMITFIYLLSRGRRFGRIIPLPEERLRRESVEYIQAIATLLRRTGQREEIVKHYHERLRRRLSERYVLDAKLPDDQLVHLAAARDPALEETALRNVLRRLSNAHVSEGELVRLASDVNEWIRKLR